MFSKPPRWGRHRWLKTNCWQFCPSALAEYESESDPAANGVDSEQQLLEELQKLVQRQPKNLLQELKALVAKFTRAEAEKRHSHWNGASLQPKNDWVTVVRGKPKKPTNAEKGPAVNQQLPGKLRADDWNAKIAQTSDELEKLLQTEKKSCARSCEERFCGRHVGTS